MSDGEQAQFSVFSKAAYDFYYSGIVQAQKELFEYGYHDWIIDPGLSDDSSVVLKNNDDIVISYRGTDVSNFSDIVTDAQILFGRHRSPLPSQRFVEAEAKYFKTKEKYDTSTITLTGHSLGNTQALYVGRQHGIRSVGFNAGSSVADAAIGQLCRLSGLCEDYKRHSIYSTTGDIISFSSTFGTEQIKRVAATKKSSHSLLNFLPDKKSGVVPKYLVRRSAKQKSITDDEECRIYSGSSRCRLLAKFSTA